MLELTVLGSGSKGNSTLISDGEFSFIIDAGFSGLELEKRLKQVNRSICEIQAILITHDHGDHINGAGVISRKTGSLVYANLKMIYKLKRRIGKKIKFNLIEPDVSLNLGSMKVTPFETPHDAIHACGYIIEQDGLKIGFATDIGYPSENVIESLQGCNTVVLESNHDTEMLKNGPYPQALQDRVAGDSGHLSNEQTEKILTKIASENLKRVIFVHLSTDNNTEELVIASAQKALKGFDTEIVVSSQRTATEIFSVK